MFRYYLETARWRRPIKKFLPANIMQICFTIIIVLIVRGLIVHGWIQHAKYNNAGSGLRQPFPANFQWMQNEIFQKLDISESEFRDSSGDKDLAIIDGISDHMPIFLEWKITGVNPGKVVPTIVGDYAFLSIFKLEIIKGRAPDQKDIGRVCLLNETAYREFHLASLENVRVENREGIFDVIGVVKDFHYGSLHKLIGPVFVLPVSGVWLTPVSTIYNRMN